MVSLSILPTTFYAKALLLHPCLAHAQTRLPKQLVYHSECLSPCKGMAEFGLPHLLWEKKAKRLR